MCVYDITELEILEEDLTAYKVVKAASSPLGTRFLSLTMPLVFLRIAQPRFRSTGKRFYPNRYGSYLKYNIGEKVTSLFKKTPGLYCFAKKDGAENAGIALDSPSVALLELLEVLIPKGTKIRRASSSGSYSKDCNFLDVILTEELIPIKVVKKEDYSVHS